MSMRAQTISTPMGRRFQSADREYPTAHRGVILFGCNSFPWYGILGVLPPLTFLRSKLDSNREQMPGSGERQLLRDREARAERQAQGWGKENSLTRMWNVSCSGQSSMWGSAAQVFRRKVRKLQDPVGAPKGSRSRPSAAGKPTCLVCLFRG